MSEGTWAAVEAAVAAHITDEFPDGLLGAWQLSVEVVAEDGSSAHTAGVGSVLACLGLTDWARRKLREELG